MQSQAHFGVSSCVISSLNFACRALDDAQLPASEVDYVNAHATSTKAGDMAEYKALRSAIPGHNVRINSTKGMIGHLLGAAGAVEAIASIQAIQTGELALHADLLDPSQKIRLRLLA